MQLVCLFLGFMFLAGQLNHAIYRLAWNARPIGPWTKPHPEAPPRRWSDFLPIMGWFGLERERRIHGTWFWLRPMLIELVFPMAMCLLYQYELDGALHPGDKLSPALLQEIRVEFVSHVILLSLMLVATFVDLDEKTIPDAITITGTLAGLIMASAWPESLLPDGRQTLWLTAPRPWQPALSGPQGLGLGLGVIAAWCVALAPRTVYFRRGAVKGLQFLLASIWRGGGKTVLATLGVLCSLLTVAVWRVGGDRWQGLLTSLVGLAAGGALVWSIRVAASTALRKEALGFGDVTLMAMIGSFAGWQASILIFFMAPFAGVVIAVAQFMVSRRHDIAYGPYLCLAAAFAVLVWPGLWSHWGFAFGLGWMIPALLLICILLMAIMLLGYRKFTGQ